MDREIKCPKCQDEMVQGFIPDYAYGTGRRFVSSWVEGAPKKSFWTHEPKVPFEGGMPIAAFLCKGCGYLEFYADEKFAAQ